MPWALLPPFQAVTLSTYSLAHKRLTRDHQHDVLIDAV